ncbi:MAG: glycosyltransferase [Mycobacteriales bacterium]
MRVGLIAPPWVPVPPPRYGGTEQVVADLAAGLTDRGHDVRLFTVGESTCDVPSHWLFDKAVTALNNNMAEAAHALTAYQVLADVDVIHDHTLIGPLVTDRSGPPVVTTNHGVFSDQARVIYREAARRAAVVAISHSQRATAPDVPVTAVIHHGIDLRRYAFGGGEGHFLLFVGRMSPDKGVHRAIRVARRAGRRLVLISKMREHDERAYFEEQVQPLLGPDVELVEELSAPERIAYLQEATAVLNPICWSEPFGLVMAEALSCGTPVLAFPNGAAPEIVDDGETGFLCADEDAMVRAVSLVDAIDRRACRAAAEARFDRSRMAEDHERLYTQVLGRQAPEAAVAGLPAPRTQPAGNGLRLDLTSGLAGGVPAAHPPALPTGLATGEGPV